MGSHGAFNRKEYPCEESVRIPAIFHWPEAIGRQTNNESLFSIVDLLPTTLGLLGLPLPSYLQGTDFSPALRGELFESPQAVLLELCGNPRWSLDFIDWRGFVTEKWKYAFFETGQECLFDLENDPYEQNNLASIDTERCTIMRRQLLTLLHETREPYFDVLIEHGVAPDVPTLDVSEAANNLFVEGKALLSPSWAAGIVTKPQ